MLFKKKNISIKLKEYIDERLENCGFYFRSFSRVKTIESTKQKLKKKRLENQNYKIQDLIGIRIVLYFSDDVDIISKNILEDFELVKEKIDNPSFESPLIYRNNYTYKIPEAWIADFNSNVSNKEIDSTFELQVRTINSEAWQELDHDYLYKNEMSNNKKYLKEFFTSLGIFYKGIEENLLAFYESSAEKAYETKDILNFIKYKFHIKINGLNRIDELCKENFEPNLLEILLASDREKVLSKFIQLNPNSPISIEDLFNYCLEYMGKEKVFDSPNELNFFIDKIPNLNRKLGTVHDPLYDRYKEFRDSFNDDNQPVFDSSDNE